MVSFEDALEKARQRYSRIESCTETESCYLFNGEMLPCEDPVMEMNVAVLKSDGSIVEFVEYLRLKLNKEKPLNEFIAIDGRFARKILYFSEIFFFGPNNNIEIAEIDGRLLSRDDDSDDWKEYCGDSAKWLCDLKKLHLEKWKDEYLNFRRPNGTGWALEFYDCTFHEKTGMGKNPRNWKKFMTLLEEIGFDSFQNHVIC